MKSAEITEQDKQAITDIINELEATKNKLSALKVCARNGLLIDGERDIKNATYRLQRFLLLKPSLPLAVDFPEAKR